MSKTDFDECCMMYGMMYNVSTNSVQGQVGTDHNMRAGDPKAASAAPCPDPAVSIRFNPEEGYLAPSLELLHQRQSRYSLLLLTRWPRCW